MLKKIVIIGSDTDYGKIAFDFFSKFSDFYKIVGLTFFSKDRSLFVDQLKLVNPQYVFVYDLEESKSLEIEYNNSNCSFISGDNITNYIKQSDADIYVFCDSDIDCIKAILSVIYNQKDVVLMSTDAVLSSGKILAYESKLKGVNFYPITLQTYSLNQFFKVRSNKELDKIILMNIDKKLDKEDIDELRSQKIDFNLFKESFYNFTHFNLIKQLYLLNYFYDISVEKFDFFKQNKNIITVIAEFNDGSNLINTTNNDLYPVLYYYFCKDKSGFVDKNLLISGDKINLSLSRIDVSKEIFLKLGIDFLKKGGSYPIVYFFAFELFTKKYFDNKIKYKDIPLKLKEILEDKSFYSTKPDLKTILALKSKLESKFL